MTSVGPHGVPPEPGCDGLRRFADAWAHAVAGSGFVPMSFAELHRLLLRLSHRLAAGLAAEPFSAAEGYAAGTALVVAYLRDPCVLEATLPLVGRDLPAAAGLAGVGTPRLADRVAALQAAVAVGYAQALRDVTMAEQERLGRAVLDAHAQVERALRASEARFRAIFAGAAIGIGIGDMDGRIVQVNQAFADLLGYSVAEMCRLTITDLAHPDDPPGMWDLYAAMVRGERNHVRLAKAYQRKDGGVVRTDLTVSLIRDDAGTPQFTVAMVDDVTDRHPPR